MREALADPRPSGSRAIIDCPHCCEQMDQLECEVKPSIIVDECALCSGVFLDFGELAAIRQRPLTHEERKRFRTRQRHRAARHGRKQRAKHNEGVAPYLAVFVIAANGC